MSTKNKEETKKKKKEQQGEDDLDGDIMPEELSEEDQKLKQELELLVERTSDTQPELVAAAITALKREIRTSTSSMTSVPKPLKFLTGHYDTLKANYEKLQGANKGELADVLSWLGMTLGFQTRDCLNFKLKGTKEAVSTWGHEYVRHLCLEIGDEFQERSAAAKPLDDLYVLVDEIVPFLVTHNAEPDACDILMEVERLPSLVNVVDETNYKRICLYLESCANYEAEPEDTDTLRVAMKIFHKMGHIPETLRLALALDDKEFIKQLWADTQDLTLKKQLALMLGQHGYFSLIQDEENDVLQELMGNMKRNSYFHHLAKDLDILEPKAAEDIYKSNLSDKKEKAGGAKADSARQNLAATFVNAFVNSGFGSDKLMTTEGAEGDWLFKNREHGRISAVASLGMIHLWDPDTGVNAIDRYSYIKNDDFVKAGVMLGVGVVNANVRNIFDIAYTFMADHASSNSAIVKQSIALGLGIAYAGSGHDATHELLIGMYNEGRPTLELQAHVALALGFLHVGSCHADLTELFVNTLCEEGFKDGLKSTYSRYLCLALGLLFLGKQEAAEVTLEALKTVPGVMGKYALLTVETCAYAGTGNVLKIQKLLAACGEHLEDKDNTHQSVAVLGIALIALREEIGRDMVIRSFDHLLQYGEVNIRRAVPLALGILSVCDPDISVMDTLSKFSHDHDAEVAMGAIFALGLIGAGTNNSRIATLLRGLASYYHKEPNQLFVVRLAQGILHMGKGTISLNPYHSSGLLLRPAAMAGLLALVHTCFDFKGLILGRAHYMLYTLALAMTPRMLLTLNEDLEPQSIPVRVGQAVDVIGKAGNPKTITGFQTHHTPVLLSAGDRAEFATDEFLPVSPILEGCVVIKTNPDARKFKKKKK